MTAVESRDQGMNAVWFKMVLVCVLFIVKRVYSMFNEAYIKKKKSLPGSMNVCDLYNHAF